MIWHLLTSNDDGLHAKYKDWLNHPQTKPIRLFDSSILECTTMTKWWMIPLIWLPFALWSAVTSWDSETSMSRNITTFAAGFITWPLFEYTMHRFLFHMPVFDNRFLILFHFLLHGIHHITPFDPHRLVIPPLFGFGVLHLLKSFFILFIPNVWLFGSGMMCTYVIYDVTHYWVHQRRPWCQSLKRHHMEHHFKDEMSNFGITTTFYDYVFSTKRFF